MAHPGESNHKPYIIALTGGPCAGKTTLLHRLQALGELAGRKLVFVPEAATILVGRGHVIGQNVREFQTEVLRLQSELEDRAIAEAEASGEPCAIVCDRGMLDGAGYCSDDLFAEIVKAAGQDQHALTARYDLVIHLVSAAVDAPEAYTTGNNTARHESLEEAIEQERRTLVAWERHPNRVVVASSQGFDRKMDAAIAAMRTALG